jgi:hypothetical protein
MRPTLPICCAVLALAGCQTPEEKAIARYAEWAEACSAPPTSNPFRQALNERAVEACMARLEASYQADRARAVSSSAALLGLGAYMMTTPPTGGASNTAHCTTSMQSGGMYPTWSTKCY